MKAAGVQPNVVAYASLARPFAHRGEWQEVENFADDMQKAGLVMSPGCIKETSCEYSQVLALTSNCKVAVLLPFKITVVMDTVADPVVTYFTVP
eukprot:s2801_g12.t1